MYSVLYDDNIEARARSKPLIRLLEIYRDHAKGGLPDYADFNPTRLEAYRDWMAVMFRQPNGQFLYGFAGAALGVALNRELTGRSTESFGKDVGGFLATTAEQALAGGKPVFTLHRSINSARNLWERLILPVRLGDGGLAIITYGSVRSFQVDLVQSLFEASEDGIIAATALRAPSGELADFVVQAVNLRASAVLAVPLSDIEDGQLSESVPRLRASEAWPRMVEAAETGKTRSCEIAYDDGGAAARWLKITASPLGDGVALTISDVTINHQTMADLDRQRAELTYANHVLAAQAEELSEIAFEAELARAKLSEEVKRREELETELKRLARFDLLTGVMNRLGFEEAARQTVAAATRYDNELSLILVDADRFKSINDRYGHAGGDQALKHLANVLSAGVRDNVDCVGRIGGEEFAILLPQTGLQGAQILAERLRAMVSGETLALAEGRKALRMTASFGVASFSGEVKSFEQLMQRADMALYRAKNGGRDQVVCDETQPSAA